MQIRTRQRGNCSTLAGKSRGGTPFCRMRKTVFPKRSSPRKTTRIRFGKAGAHPHLALGIAITPETLSHIYNFSILKAIAILPIFSQIFVVFHCAVLLFAPQMWATRPHLGSIFVKLLHRKTFQLPAARISAATLQNLTALVFFHKNFPIT